MYRDAEFLAGKLISNSAGENAAICIRIQCASPDAKSAPVTKSLVMFTARNKLPNMFHALELLHLLRHLNPATGSCLESVNNDDAGEEDGGEDELNAVDLNWELVKRSMDTHPLCIYKLSRFRCRSMSVHIDDWTKGKLCSQIALFFSHCHELDVFYQRGEELRLLSQAENNWINGRPFVRRLGFYEVTNGADEWGPSAEGVDAIIEYFLQVKGGLKAYGPNLSFLSTAISLTNWPSSCPREDGGLVTGDQRGKAREYHFNGVSGEGFRVQFGSLISSDSMWAIDLFFPKSI